MQLLQGERDTQLALRYKCEMKGTFCRTPKAKTSRPPARWRVAFSPFDWSKDPTPHWRLCLQHLHPYRLDRDAEGRGLVPQPWIESEEGKVNYIHRCIGLGDSLISYGEKIEYRETREIFILIVQVNNCLWLVGHQPSNQWMCIHCIRLPLMRMLNPHELHTHFKGRPCMGN